MKVITLTGGRSTGKTTVLKDLYTLLTKNKNEYEIILPPTPCPASPDQDLEFFINYRGKRIGIVTAGDYALETIRYLGVFYGRNADVLVIANSNKKRPVDVIRWLNYEHVNVDKISIHETGIAEQIITLL